MTREDFYFAAGSTLKGVALFLGVLFGVAVLSGKPNESITPLERAGRVGVFLLINAAIYGGGSILVGVGDDIKFKKELEESDRINAASQRVKEWGMNTPEMLEAIERSRGTGWPKDVRK